MFAANVLKISVRDAEIEGVEIAGEWKVWKAKV